MYHRSSSDGQRKISYSFWQFTHIFVSFKLIFANFTIFFSSFWRNVCSVAVQPDVANVPVAVDVHEICCCPGSCCCWCPCYGFPPCCCQCSAAVSVLAYAAVHAYAGIPAVAGVIAFAIKICSFAIVPQLWLIPNFVAFLIFLLLCCFCGLFNCPNVPAVAKIPAAVGIPAVASVVVQVLLRLTSCCCYLSLFSRWLPTVAGVPIVNCFPAVESRLVRRPPSWLFWSSSQMRPV